MKFFLAAAILASSFAIAPRAEAVGCLSGAVVGGVGGHVAGHHGLLGAAAGCAVGHHMAVRRNRDARQQQMNQAQPTSQQRFDEGTTPTTR